MTVPDPNLLVPDPDLTGPDPDLLLPVPGMIERDAPTTTTQPAGAEPTAAAQGAMSVEGLARVHLRSGMLLLARAELESRLHAGSMSATALVDLAEVRWRTGDLDGAAEAAAAHRVAGGTDALALLILAEAAAAAGRADDVERHVTELGPTTEAALSAMFAGMPRRADWSAVAAARTEPASPAAITARSRRSRAAASSAGSSDAVATGQPVEETSGPGVRRRPPDPSSDAETLLAEARTDLRSSDPERMGLAFDRLALALRWHPAMAADVAEMVARRQEPAALLIRGDALRALGRFLEAEAAYAAAAAALTQQPHRTT